LFLEDFDIQTRFSTTRITPVAMIAISLLACGGKKTHAARAPRIGAKETGVASWYGDPYHGRRTASGEIYDMEKMTAAHRTIAFQTWVKVENLSNGKTVDVRINDRGPFAHGRIIDLSRSAARSIGMLGPGTADVRIEVIEQPRGVPSPLPAPPPANPAPPKFGVQVGAFRQQENASRLASELHQRFGPARIVPREGSFTIWRVIVGEFTTENDAAGLVSQLSNEGMEGFTVRLDPTPRSDLP
jgi:rare lipoprotein A